MEATGGPDPRPGRGSRPRIKPEHAPYRIGGDRIRVGGATQGIASEVDDPTGAVWTLLSAMDGRRDVEQLVREVGERHPDVPGDAVRDGIRQLRELGHVEETGDADPPELTARDRARYDRSRRWFRWVDPVPGRSSWEPQVRLQQARVTIVGLGGTGGQAALALAASGVGRLHGVDPDVVELSNLNRQVLYDEADLGRFKADVAVSRLRRCNADIEVTADRHQVSTGAAMAALAEDCDVLVLAADDPPDLPVWANRAGLATGTPWVECGYHGPLVGVGVFVPGEPGAACFECLRADEEDRRAALGVRAGDAPDWAPAVGHAVAAPSAGISGLLAAHAALALLTGAPRLAAGRRYQVNLVALGQPGGPAWVGGAPRPDCPACGPTRRGTAR